MSTLLVTGASRGIGREFVRQYAQAGWRVLACCRDPAGAAPLAQLAAASDGRIELQRLDVDDPASVAAAAAALAGRPVDLLINNAGVVGNRAAAVGSMDYEVFASTLATNVLGPVRITEAFLGNLLAGDGKRVATVSSRMGSIGLAESNALIYRTSKAAVNMAMRCAALQLAGKGLVFAVLHPGWVRTDMGGPSAAIGVEESVSGMRRVIDGLAEKDNGGFFNYDGASLPW